MNLEDMYKSLILEHNRHPKNFGILENCTHQAEGKNPVCGDQYTLYAKVEKNIVHAITFSGEGCAISKASASIMTTLLTGKSLNECEQMKDAFTHMLTDENPKKPEDKTSVFFGVREFPGRVKCATLAWHALSHALKNAGEVISTE